MIKNLKRDLPGILVLVIFTLAVSYGVWEVTVSGGWGNILGQFAGSVANGYNEVTK